MTESENSVICQRIGLSVAATVIGTLKERDFGPGEAMLAMAVALSEVAMLMAITDEPLARRVLAAMFVDIEEQLQEPSLEKLSAPVLKALGR